MVDTLPSGCKKCNIHLLVGNDYYIDIESIKRITLKDVLYLLSSKLGWILSGSKQAEDSSIPENALTALIYSFSQLAAWFADLTKIEDNTSKEQD